MNICQKRAIIYIETFTRTQSLNKDKYNMIKNTQRYNLHRELHEDHTHSLSTKIQETNTRSFQRDPYLFKIDKTLERRPRRAPVTL